MDSRNGAADHNGAIKLGGIGFVPARVRSWLMATRAGDDDDRRRELALNWILLASVALAALEAGQRLPALIEGGAAVSDHVPTFALACAAGTIVTGLLVASRSGQQVLAARGLLLAYYSVATWLFIQEGTEEPVALVVCAMLIVSASVLLGPRASGWAALLITATLITVAQLGSAGVFHPPHEIPGVLEQIAIGGGLGALALVLSARTLERQDTVADLLGGVRDGPSALVGQLTVRELQVVRLIAAGRSNAMIAQELFLSPRTVHTHVSNALRKTGCTNRTELAVLAIQDGAARTEEHTVPG